MVIVQTAVTNLTDINLTGRGIKVTEMATKVTEGDIGVMERELNREGTDTTVPAGNLLSTRWTDWRGEDTSPMGIPNTSQPAVSRGRGRRAGRAAGPAAGRGTWAPGPCPGAAAALATGATPSTR